MAEEEGAAAGELEMVRVRLAQALCMVQAEEGEGQQQEGWARPALPGEDVIAMW